MNHEFSFDVFISHSGHDNDVALQLEERLTADGVRVWIDKKNIRPGEDFYTRIHDALIQSRHLVALLSAHAEDSDWVLTEMVQILSDPQNRCRRLIPLRLDNSRVATVCQRFQNIDWFPRNREKNYQKVLEACRYIHRRQKILLAKPEESLMGKRDEVEAYLKQFNEFDVISAEVFHQGDGFEQEFEEALSTADLFVQLLGPSSGRAGYVDYQAEAARQVKTLHVMQWRHLEMNPSKINDQRHRKLLNGDTVHAILLTDFKKAIRDRARAIEPATTSSAGPRSVFINFGDGDFDIANRISEICAQHQFRFVFPPTNGTSANRRKDLTTHMQDCDVLVFIYGDASYEWIRQQLSHYAIKVKRSPPRLFARYDGPPSFKPDPGIFIKDVIVIDGTQGWDDERVRSELMKIA